MKQSAKHGKDHLLTCPRQQCDRRGRLVAPLAPGVSPSKARFQLVDWEPRLPPDAKVALNTTLKCAIDTIQSLDEIDVTVEGVEPIEVGAVPALPASPLKYVGREFCEPALEFRCLLVVAADVDLEASDAPLEFTALGSMRTSADGTEVVECLARSVESPLRSFVAVLLASERLRQAAVLP